MFSGIVEEAAKVVDVKKDKDNIHITVSCSFVDQLKIDQSIAHNGVCLTVVSIAENMYTVTAIKETLQKTNLGYLKAGDKINLERSMQMDALLDGHIVQGHVDQIAECSEVKEEAGSWYFTFKYDSSLGNITVEKGSVAVNGVSLTVVNSKEGEFSVAIIPYTYEHTNFHQFKVGTIVNLEFDILGKYVTKLMKQYLGK